MQTQWQDILIHSDKGENDNLRYRKLNNTRISAYNFI